VTIMHDKIASRRRSSRPTAHLAPMIVAAFLGLAACQTVTLPSSDPNPPSLTWSFGNIATKVNYSAGGGSPSSPATVLGTIGADYNMGVQANNPGGVQSVSLTGRGMAICNGNSSTAPYTQAHPFVFTIPPQSYTYPVQSNNQVLTQENVVYTFSWANGPTMPAYAACGGLVPLAANVTYTASSSNYYGVTGQSAVKVITCDASHGCTMPNF
jgi:hypothetical protein